MGRGNGKPSTEPAKILYTPDFLNFWHLSFCVGFWEDLKPLRKTWLSNPDGVSPLYSLAKKLKTTISGEIPFTLPILKIETIFKVSSLSSIIFGLSRYLDDCDFPELVFVSFMTALACAFAMRNCSFDALRVKVTSLRELQNFQNCAISDHQ